MRNFAMVVALLLAGATVAAGQETTATIGGRVVDAQGLAVPGATVTVAGPQGTKRTTTEADGRFSVPIPYARPVHRQCRAAGLQDRRAQRRDAQPRPDRSSSRRFKCRSAASPKRCRSPAPADIVNTRTTTTGANISQRTAAAGAGRPQRSVDALSGAGRQQLRHRRPATPRSPAAAASTTST